MPRQMEAVRFYRASLIVEEGFFGSVQIEIFFPHLRR